MTGKPHITRLDRTESAQEDFKVIFSDPKHSLYFAKDSELSREYGISRHTVRTLRTVVGAPSRSKRILEALKRMPTKKHTIFELSDMLGVKYQCLYRIIRDHNIKVKSDPRQKNGPLKKKLL